MECEDISLVSKNERESKEITPLSTTFLKDTKRYLQELEDEIEKCDNSRSKEYFMMSDELKTSRGRIEDILFLRRSKIYSMAAQAVKLTNPQHKNYNRLLPEEKRIYDALIQPGESYTREIINHVLYPEEEPEPVHEEDKQEYVLVRALKDLPTLVGEDGRNYTMKAEEILTLPVSNAQTLVKRNAAQIIGN